MGKKAQRPKIEYITSLSKLFLLLVLFLDFSIMVFLCTYKYSEISMLTALLSYVFTTIALYVRGIKEFLLIILTFSSSLILLVNGELTVAVPCTLKVMALASCIRGPRVKVIVKLEYLSKLIGYFGENPQASFIVPFMLLLTFAAYLLALGKVSLANRVAELAYYNLVAGVFTALVITSKGS